MKYKALLIGNNKAIVDDFFAHITSNFELQTTSNRFDDIICHLKYYDPDVIVYCMNNETRDVMTRLLGLKKDRRIKRETIVVAVGSEASCAELRRFNVDIADLEIVKPNNSIEVQNEIIRYLNERKAKQEAIKKEQHKEELQEEVQEETVRQQEQQTSGGDSLFDRELGDKQELLERLAKELLAKAPAARKHVLVVDDDPRMLKVIKRHLEDSYDVATAVNGKVALKFLENKTTNLILLDYEMPGQNGPEVLAQLRENPVTAHIPVIFLTGINDREKIRTALSLKPQGYLLKPIERDKLLESISNILK